MQFGFRRNHSKKNAIIHLTDLISHYLDNSHKVAGIFLDTSKALDSLDHDILLQKLYTCGFHSTIFSWLKSFIVDRYQCVVHNGIQTNFIKTMYGIAQGSTLGPLMFLLYIIDLQNVSNIYDFVLFADDTTVLFHDKSVDILKLREKGKWR